MPFCIRTLISPKTGWANAYLALPLLENVWKLNKEEKKIRGGVIHPLDLNVFLRGVCFEMEYQLNRKNWKFMLLLFLT